MERFLGKSTCMYLEILFYLMWENILGNVFGAGLENTYTK